MIINKNITVKIHSSNLKYYNELLNSDFKNAELIEVSQLQIPIKSHIEVECQCDICNVNFYRKRKEIKESTLCSTSCRNIHLTNIRPNKNIKKIEVSCDVCSSKFEVSPSKFKKQENFLCSRDCYKIHRSKKYNKNNTYNYQDNKIKCSNDDCNEEIKVINWQLENRKNNFCSQECYWNHRKTHYIEFYYNNSMNEYRAETAPEKIVREYLEKNNIIYEQEKEINKYFIDFYLPEYDSIIEVYGDYWHCNPNVYGDGKLIINDNQKRQIKHDLKRNEFLKNKVNSFNIIWEKDIHENFDNVMGDIIKNIKN